MYQVIEHCGEWGEHPVSNPFNTELEAELFISLNFTSEEQDRRKLEIEPVSGGEDGDNATT